MKTSKKRNERKGHKMVGGEITEFHWWLKLFQQ